MNRDNDFKIIEKIFENKNHKIYVVDDVLGSILSTPHSKLLFKSVENSSRDSPAVVRLHHEYETIRLFDSKRIVKAYELIEFQKGYAMVMEAIEGETLRKIIDRKFAYETGDFLKKAIEITRGILDIHSKKLIHLDLNPNNIIFSKDLNHCKIIDFETSSYYMNLFSGENEPENTELFGTISYLSPEQTGRTSNSVDSRSDLYSLGASLFEILTGRPPFIAKNPADVMEMIHYHLAIQAPNACELNPQVPIILGQIVQKLLEKDPLNRYQSAYGLLKDLDTCVDQFNKNSNLSTFLLGQFDSSDKLEIPAKCYGRGPELEKIESALADADLGGRELIILSGASGMGKTALMNEIISRSNSRLCLKGSFDSEQKEVPYLALILAFEKWVDHILQQPESEINNWRTKLEQGLGLNLNWLVNIIPRIAALVGEQPPTPGGTLAEAARRSGDALVLFLKMIANQTTPLVLCLDNLQWADPQSIAVLKHISIAENLEYLCLVLGVRQSELVPEHPIHQWLESFKVNNAITSSVLGLGPISETAVEALLFETFKGKIRTDLGPLNACAAVIHQKTGGTPYYIKQILNELYVKGSIHLDFERGWGWDLEKITGIQIGANLAEFLTEKLKQLNPELKDLLKFLSLLGMNFELAQVKLLYKTNEISPNLRQLVKEGFIEKKGSNYKFVHETLKVAAETLWTQKDREETHLRYGIDLYNLAKANSTFDQADSWKEILKHWNQCVTLFSSQESEIQSAFVKGNLLSAEHSGKIFAYDLMENYLLACEALVASLNNEKFIKDHLFLLMFMHNKKANYSIFNKLYYRYLEVVKDPVEREPAFRLKIYALRLTGEAAKCATLAAEIGAQYGIKVPRKANAFALIFTLINIRFNCSRKKLEHLAKAPVVQDPKLKLAIELIAELVLATVNGNNRKLFLVQINFVLRLLHRHGLTPAVHPLLAMITVYFGQFNRDYKTSALLAKTGREIDVRLPYGNAKPVSEMSFYTYTSFYLSKPEVVFKDAEHVIKICVDYSAREMLAVTFYRLLAIGLTTTRTIPQSLSESLLKHIKILEVEFELQRYPVDSLLELLNRLRDPEPPEFLDGKFLNRKKVLAYLRITPIGLAKACFHGADAMYHSVLEKKQAAFDAIKLYEPHRYILDGVPIGNFFEFHIAVFLSKMLLATRQNSTAADTPEGFFDHKFQKFSLNYIKTAIKNFQTYCKNANPDLFRARYLILMAEWELLHNRKPNDLYIEAIEEAKRQRFTGVLADALRRFAEYHYQKGYSTHAEILMREAVKAYDQWGAQAIVSFLNEKYQLNPTISKNLANNTLHRTSQFIPKENSNITVSTTAVSNSTLNFQSILKASSTLAKEVVLERLLNSLLGVITENAGADECWIFLKSNQQWLLGTYSKYSDPKYTQEIQKQFTNSPLKNINQVSKRIIDYVIRSQKPVLVSDVSSEPDFMDADFSSRPIMKSLLCFPIISKGIVISVLYLENRILSGAFTKKHLSTLNMLGGQIAVSIENSVLYRSMEKEIFARTKDVHSILENVTQGIFTFGSDEKIHAGYANYLNTIFSAKHLGGLIYHSVLFDSTPFKENLDAFSQMRAAISDSFGEKLFQFQVNSDALPSTVTRRVGNIEGSGEPVQQVLELDWVPIEDSEGNIIKIMVTVRDVTKLKKIEAKTKAQGRELDMIQKIISIPQGRFENFMKGCFQSLDEMDTHLSGDFPTIPIETIKKLFGYLHTIKGNSGIYHLSDISSVVHEAENVYAEILEDYQGQEAAPVNRFIRREEISGIRSALKEYDSLYTVKIKQENYSSNNLDRWTQVSELLEKKQYDLIETIVREQFSLPLNQVLDPIKKSLLDISRLLGKEVPSIHFTGESVRILTDKVTTIESIFGHIFRNSMDHGIEAGKLGSISLHGATSSNGNLIIHVFDSGKGLNLESLSKKDPSKIGDLEIAEIMFNPGTSTASKISDISGRGVGMSAIRNLVEKMKGRVTIEFRADRDKNGKRPFSLVLEFPPTVAVTSKVPPGEDRKLEKPGNI